MIKLVGYTDITNANTPPIQLLKELPNVYENIKLDYKTGKHQVSEYYLIIDPIGVAKDILVCNKTQQIKTMDYGCMLIERYEFFNEKNSVIIENYIKKNKVETRQFYISERQSVIDQQIESASKDVQPFVLALFHAWSNEIADFVNFGTGDWRNRIENESCPVVGIPVLLWTAIRTALLSLEI